MTNDDMGDVMRKLDDIGKQMGDLRREFNEFKATQVTPQQVDDKIAEASQKSRDHMDDTLKDFKTRIMATVNDTLDATIRKAAQGLAEQTKRAADQMADYQKTMEQRDDLRERESRLRDDAIKELDERIEKSETDAAIAKTTADQIKLHLYGDNVNKGLIDQFKESLEIIGEIRDLKKAEDKRKQDMHDMVMSVLSYFPQTKRGKRIASGLALPVSAAAYTFITNFGGIVSWIYENASHIVGG